MAVPVLMAGALRLLDHLVRDGQQRFGDGKAERLGGLHVDDEFELSRLANLYGADLRQRAAIATSTEIGFRDGAGDRLAKRP
jgi:hypothetical protein